MGWAVGFDTNWNRDVGYGVPSICDYPECTERIDRGLGYVCGGEPFGGEHGCGLFFCIGHLSYDEKGVQLCPRCMAGEVPFKPKPDLPEWLNWKLTDMTWAKWRSENPEEVARIRELLTTGN